MQCQGHKSARPGAICSSLAPPHCSEAGSGWAALLQGRAGRGCRGHTGSEQNALDGSPQRSASRASGFLGQRGAGVVQLGPRGLGTCGIVACPLCTEVMTVVATRVGFSVSFLCNFFVVYKSLTVNLQGLLLQQEMHIWLVASPRCPADGSPEASRAPHTAAASACPLTGLLPSLPGQHRAGQEGLNATGPGLWLHLPVTRGPCPLLRACMVVLIPTSLGDCTPLFAQAASAPPGQKLGGFFLPRSQDGAGVPGCQGTATLTPGGDGVCIL